MPRLTISHALGTLITLEDAHATDTALLAGMTLGSTRMSGWRVYVNGAGSPSDSMTETSRSAGGVLEWPLAESAELYEVGATMRTMAIASQKGGCGKTTTAINLAAGFTEFGKRVLLVDFDPQGHATIGLGHDPDAFSRTIYDALIGECVLSDAIVHTAVPNLDVAPCNVLLAGVEMELSRMPGKEQLLDRCLQTVQNRYDLCVIDCPPSVGVLTLNALVASSDVIVPVQMHYYAIEGLRRLMETVQIMRGRLHPGSAETVGVLLTLVEERTGFSRQIQKQMRDVFGELVFKTVIHRNIRLAEAPSAGEPVFTYSPRSRGAADYRSLATEILQSTPSTPLIQ